MSASGLASRNRALKSGTPFASRQKELSRPRILCSKSRLMLPCSKCCRPRAPPSRRRSRATALRRLPGRRLFRPRRRRSSCFAPNPAAGEIVWKAHQHFSDGTVADWVGAAGDKRPASVTKLSAQSAAPKPSGEVAAIETWLKGYDAAFNERTCSSDTQQYEARDASRGTIRVCHVGVLDQSKDGRTRARLARP
jgi:hypothetical protein